MPPARLPELQAQIDEAPLQQLRLFAEDVAPRVRALVHRERGTQAH